MNKLKVLCLPDGLPLDYTIQFANSLSKKLEVMIIIQKTPNVCELDELLENLNSNITLHISKNIKYPLYNLRNAFVFLDIINQIRKFDPDIIHTQNGDIISVLSSMLIRKPLLLTTLHDVNYHPGQGTWLFKFVRYWSLKKSKYIFVHGEKLKKILADKNSFPKEKICVIPIGEHNVAPFVKYSNNKSITDNSVLFFGWISIRKGLEYLIEAENIISAEVPGTKIIIAGNVGYPKEYYEKINDMINNNKNFEIYPKYISWEFGAELFQRASLIVLPYVEVSQSGVVSTAYGFKKPVVVTDTGSLAEIVDDGITGFVVPPKDSAALAGAIIRLLKDSDLRKSMGENAYQKLKNDLSWDNITETTINIYEKAMGEYDETY